jgi:hypothetical protein
MTACLDLLLYRRVSLEQIFCADEMFGVIGTPAAGATPLLVRSVFEHALSLYSRLLPLPSHVATWSPGPCESRPTPANREVRPSSPLQIFRQLGELFLKVPVFVVRCRNIDSGSVPLWVPCSP